MQLGHAVSPGSGMGGGRDMARNGGAGRGPGSEGVQDAGPWTGQQGVQEVLGRRVSARPQAQPTGVSQADRKSTRLNSSHVAISYAVFCLKKKKTKTERA